MKKNRRTSKCMRVYAWLMAAIMMCTGLNVTAYAQEESYDTGYVLEQQEDQGTEAEVQEAIPEDTDEEGNLYEDSQEEADIYTDEITDADTAEEESEEETDFIIDAETEESEEALPVEETLDDSASEFKDGTASVTVYFSFSQDAAYADNQMGKIQKPVALRKLTVPYFDLARYGLENFYFSSEKYDSSGVTEGTAESAYNKVTVLHLFIYATEVLYLNLPADQAGRGYLKEKGYLDDGKTLNITGSRGSMYMKNIWGLDENLNYYLNYKYPEAAPGWGSTADQILLHDGDIVTLMHYSDWNFWSDAGSGFNILMDGDGNQTTTTVSRDETTEVSFQVYRAQSGLGIIPKNQSYDLYYIPVADMVSGDVTSWKYLGTTTDGKLTVSLDKFENGEYFVGIPGQPGNSTKSICSSPGGIYVTVNSTHEHAYDEGVVVKEPTCGQPGEKIYTCMICQEEKTEEIPKTGNHTYNNGVVTREATCKEAGEKTFTCTVCGATRTEAMVFYHIW